MLANCKTEELARYSRLMSTVKSIGKPESLAIRGQGTTIRAKANFKHAQHPSMDDGMAIAQFVHQVYGHGWSFTLTRAVQGPALEEMDAKKEYLQGPHV
eukprot:6476881-Amphidinium_carterae.3